MLIQSKLHMEKAGTWRDTRVTSWNDESEFTAGQFLKIMNTYWKFIDTVISIVYVYIYIFVHMWMWISMYEYKSYWKILYMENNSTKNSKKLWYLSGLLHFKKTHTARSWPPVQNDEQSGPGGFHTSALNSITWPYQWGTIRLWENHLILYFPTNNEV